MRRHLHNPKFRTVSMIKSLEGAEQPTAEDLEQFKILKIEFRDDDILFNLNPEPEESAQLELESKYKSIFDEYGFVSPAAIIIEEYVKFYSVRTQSNPHYTKYKSSIGLRAEKSFDLILQNIGLYHFYTEPIRDWRLLKPCDFHLPLIGLVEVKSGNHAWQRCNVNIAEWNSENRVERVHYLVALDNLCSRYLKLIGAMPAKMVENHPEWYKQRTKPKDDFWTIPYSSFPIKPEALHRALCEAKSRIDKMQPIILQ